MVIKLHVRQIFTWSDTNADTLSVFKSNHIYYILAAMRLD